MLAVTACSSDGTDDEASTTSTSSIVDTDSGDTDRDDTGADAASERSEDFPCDLVATEDVEALVGAADLGTGQAVRTGNAFNDLQWESTSCTWTGDNEVRVDVADGAGFEGGEVECPDDVDMTPISGPADETSWEWDGLLRQAELQLCTTEWLVEISVETWNEADQAGAQVALVSLAELVTAGL